MPTRTSTGWLGVRTNSADMKSMKIFPTREQAVDYEADE